MLTPSMQQHQNIFVFTSVLHAKVAPGWALIRENLNPIRKIHRAKSGIMFYVVCTCAWNMTFP